MFYAQLILARRGALGKVWLAAHWHTKLTKTQVLATDIAKSVKTIIDPEVPMALRMSGHLLLGVARIYSKQVDYLLSECNDALVKIKMAFRPGDANIDLAPAQTVASYNAITLRIDLPESELMELSIPTEVPETILPEVDISDLLDINMVHKRQITTNMRPVDDRDDLTQDNMLSLAFQEFPGEEDDPLLRPIGEEPDQPERLRQSLSTPIPMDIQQLPGLSLPVTPMGVPSPIEADYEPADYGEVAQFPMTPTTPLGTSISAPITPIITVRPSKKGVIVDTINMIDSKTIKRQLEDSSLLLREMIPAPPNKRAMYRREREIAGPESFLKEPLTFEVLAPELKELFSRNMSSKNPGKLLWLEEKEVPTVSEPGLEPGFETGFEPGFETGFEPGFEPGELGEHGEHGEHGYELEPTESHIQSSPRKYRPSEAGETVEPEIIQRGEFSERTKRMHTFLEKSFQDKASLSYLSMVEGKRRRTVVGTFFELLVLKTTDFINVIQNEPYQDIQITKGPNFNSEILVPAV